jgi:aspartyl protease family protein
MDNQSRPKQSLSEPSLTKMGRGMWFLAWGLVLLLLTLYFADLEQSWQNPNQQLESRRLENYTEVVLKRNRYGHYVTSGTINHRPVTFLLDTGATQVAVPMPLAQQLGLPKGAEFRTMTANGIGRSFATRIEHLTIGDIEFRDIPAGIAENMPGDEVLLGMSVLKHIEFTQRGDTLILRQYH